MKTIPSFEHLSDEELTNEAPRLVSSEHHATASFVSWLMEFDKRRLYLPAGFSSLFTYCRDWLHLGEGAAYRRIEAARTARRFPLVLQLIASGSVTLSNLVLISQHLTAANHRDLLTEIAHKKKTEVEVIAARLKPRPDVPTVIRKVSSPFPQAAPPQPASASEAVAVPKAVMAGATPHPDPPRPVIAPLSPERFRLQVTISGEAHEDLRQLQNLMRHAIPSGDAARIVERALKVLLKDVLRNKCGIVNQPRRGDALQKLIEVH